VFSPAACPALRIARHLLLVPLVLAAAGAAALPIDLAVARTMTDTGWMPNELHRLIVLSEAFAYGSGVAVILLCAFLIDPAARRAMPRMAAGSLGAGILTNSIKLLVARTRPMHASLSGSALETFGGWLPLTGGHSAHQSFPSSHAATAVGLAVMLAWRYPRGRYLFAALAVLASVQRIESLSHFTSDTLWGAAIGYFLASACIGGTPLARRFDRLEGVTTRREQRAAVPERSAA
jgi:membrane-associated phospholipid phosphatase